MAIVQNVAVRDYYVLPAVVVEVSEMGAECQWNEARRPDSRALRFVAEQVVSRIPIEGVHLKRVVCDKQVHAAVVVVIASGDAHTGLCRAIHSERNGLLNSILMKRAVAI